MYKPRAWETASVIQQMHTFFKHLIIICKFKRTCQLTQQIQ